MTRCETISDELKAYMDGELPLDRRAAVRLHLLRCASCREEIGIMESISSELKAGETNGFNAALRERLLESAPDSAAGPNEPEIPLWRRRPIQLWGAAAAVVLMFVITAPLLTSGKPAAEMKGRMYPNSTASIPPPPQMAQTRQAEMKKMNGPAESPMAAGGASAPESVMHSEVGRDDVFAVPGTTGGPPPASTPANAAGERSVEAKGTRQGWFADSHERKVIRNASISVRVEKLEEKSESVERLVANAGGFIANNRLSTGEEGLKTAFLTVRVPVNGFDSFLRDVAKLGEVTAKNVTGEDITEKLTDDQKEAGVLRSDLAEVRKRLASPSRNWQDEESERLLKIRAAQTEGRIELMRKLAALGKVEIQLSEQPKTAIKSGGFLTEMSETGRAAVNSFLNAARIPVLLLIWVVAYAPVWVPLAVGFRYAVRAHKKSVAIREAREWQAQREAAKA